MRKYKISRYGQFDHIFDIKMKMWYGWVVVKRFKADLRYEDTMIDNIIYCNILAEELLEKLKED